MSLEYFLALFLIGRLGFQKTFRLCFLQNEMLKTVNVLDGFNRQRNAINVPTTEAKRITDQRN